MSTALRLRRHSGASGLASILVATGAVFIIGVLRTNPWETGNKGNMTNRNLLLGRSKPSEKLTREEIAALEAIQQAAPIRPVSTYETAPDCTSAIKSQLLHTGMTPLALPESPRPIRWDARVRWVALRRYRGGDKGKHGC